MTGTFRRESGAVVLAVVLCVAACGTAEIGDGPWTQLEPGLEVVRFDTRSLKVGGEQDLTILRVDPDRWDLRFLAAEKAADGLPRTAQGWCVDFGLAAAVNAGMFQADGKTHVGFCQADGEVLNSFANGYLSAVGIDPVDAGQAPFRIFDLDHTPLAEVALRYRTVVQNLRLIKRGGENRWEPAGDRWPEAALGEDRQGRALRQDLEVAVGHDGRDLQNDVFFRVQARHFHVQPGHIALISHRWASYQILRAM